MSIATDVSRIKGNITAALAAIADKGVTVPDGSTSDALASLIASIEAGGGGLKNNRLAVVASGSFTVSERTEVSSNNRFILQHDSGVIPLLIIIEASKCSAASDFYNGVFFREPNPNIQTSSNVLALCTRRTSSTYTYYSNFSIETGTLSGSDWTTDHVNLVCYNTTMYFKSGITYIWYAYYAE